MNKNILTVILLGCALACSKDGGPSTIPNATWVMEKMIIQLGGAEYEITDPPPVNITINEGSFSYADDGQSLSGSWKLNQTDMLLSVTNPDGTELSFPLISFSNDSWTFTAQEIDLKKASFTEDEGVTLDMVNMKLIESGKKLDDEIAAGSLLKVQFVMKRV